MRLRLVDIGAELHVRRATLGPTNGVRLNSASRLALFAQFSSRHAWGSYARVVRASDAEERLRQPIRYTLAPLPPAFVHPFSAMQNLLVA